MSRVRVKICGVTREEDALLAASLGADALGFNFWPGSRRFVPPAAARRIIARLRRCGAANFLVGEALVRAPDPGALLRALAEAR